MTLSRQLIALVLVLLLLVFVGTFFISVQNTRTYLEAQLQSHAQDTATSLGLSISTHLAERDIASVTSMTNAIFDRGNYRQVRVEDIRGKPLVDRILPVQVEGIPDWFITFLPLETPEGEAIVMAGWNQAGRVRVKSSPGYAYLQLWDNASHTAGWFLVSTVFVLLVGMMLLRWVLRPLKQVEWQANSICNREFPVQEQLPRTRDLRRIVEAMNRLSQKVQRMLSDLDELVDRLREQAYKNPVTGLVNKRRFMDIASDRIWSREVFSQGAFCLVALKGFKAFNDKHGYQAGDELLQEVASGLGQVADRISHHTLAHLAGADFALLVEDYSVHEAEKLGQRLSATLAGIYAAGKTDSSDVGHVGIAYFDGRQNLKELLFLADMALRSAQTKEANGWHLCLPEEMIEQSVRGAMEWRTFIKEALEQGRIVLHYQPVVSCPSQELLHEEVLVRVAENDGNLVSAGLFLPMAESVGVMTDIDRAVINKALEELNDNTKRTSRLAINLSPQSVEAPAFLDWLERLLPEQLDIAGRLIFEMPEYGAVARLEQVKTFIERIARFGVGFGFDHFGHNFSSLAYLRSLNIEYLKLDGSYLRTLDENSDHQFYVQALADIAHGLDIQVIAESVESEQVWNLLPGFHLDGAQGYFIGRPE